MPDQPGKTSRKKARPVDLDTLGLEMGNKPPQALEVEEAVLGAMLIEPSSVDTALEELTVSCFYDPRHRMIFEAMNELVNEHVSVDIVTVSTKLGHAVVRNRVRRRIREIFRLSQGKMKQGYDCIVVARTRAAHADYWELKRAFEKTCKKLDLWETQA